MVIARIILVVLGLFLTSIVTLAWVNHGAPQDYEQAYTAVVLHFTALLCWVGLWEMRDE